MSKVEALVQSLGIAGLSKSEVSRLCSVLDEQAEIFRTRPLDAVHPYFWLDARVRHEAPCHRAGGRNPPTVCRSRSLKLEAA